MVIAGEPWTSPAPDATGRQLIQIPHPVIDALANGDLESARDIFTQALTPYLVSDECRSLWKRRSAQIKADPRGTLWNTRLVLDSESGVIVGRAGYHSQPNHDGMVEVGYQIDPLYRRRGHARAALRILINVAANDPHVKVVRATVAAVNLPSTALVTQCGFLQVGEQWDEEDGLEKVFEISVS